MPYHDASCSVDEAHALGEADTCLIKGLRNPRLAAHPSPTGVPEVQFLSPFLRHVPSLCLDPGVLARPTAAVLAAAAAGMRRGEPAAVAGMRRGEPAAVAGMVAGAPPRDPADPKSGAATSKTLWAARCA
jgi:hypothetical protein